ncbi:MULTISPECIES: hypothetical protein [Thermovenabulum]|uniref:Uncharacterized protein n=1 Tax=Thermovenabulum gondwanense TaxID=520767 RepID=A0A162MHP9_9FIRM|nr:hypothetical protein [Thermovenabulum gondwanense]KYO66088.1 hypothetical protein ATZ99_12740 [Thermovenabulum gondwanense]
MNNMNNLTPTIGWGWWLLIHIIAIPLLIYWGLSMKKEKTTE